VLAEACSRQASEPSVSVDAANYGDRFSFEPGTRPWGRHALIEAAVESVGIQPGTAVHLTLRSTMPPGASTGTSAAVVVAVIGALRALRGLPWDPGGVARAAHTVETGLLRQQSGVQDQLAAAHGGINYLEIHAYPHAAVTPLEAPEPWLRELEARLVLVYLGRGHRSTEIHDAVIREVADIGPAHAAIQALRQAAADARDAVRARDFAALAAALRANTDAQRRLHPALVDAEAEAVIGAARNAGAIGWKINGAGGGGGSVALLAGAAAGAAAVAQAVCAPRAAWSVIPVQLAREGLVVYDGAGQSES
jgi:D-glycero-alpha-D-manno-heptose-7-phosphate kinase